MAGGKMKSTGTIEDKNGLWRSPDTGATNESGVLFMQSTPIGPTGAAIENPSINPSYKNAKLICLYYLFY